MPSLHSLRFLPFIFFLFVPLSALEFRVLSWGGLTETLYFDEKARLVEIVANETAFSPVYQTTETKALVLHKKAVVEGREKLIPVGSFPIPTGLTHAILILSQKKANYVGFWADDNLARFPVGGFVLHNFSTAPIALKVGDTTHLIAPQAGYAQKFPPGAKMGHIMAATPDGESIRFVLNSRLRIHPDYRIFYFFRNGRPIDSSGRVEEPIEFVMIYDYQKPAEVEGEVFTLPTS